MRRTATSTPRRGARLALAGIAAFVLLAGIAVAAPAQPDPASRLPKGDEASEYWDVTAVFESQHRFFGRWMITNEGPGTRSAIAIGHLVFPDGRSVPFKNGRRSGRWELSDDGRRIHVASSILDLRGPRGLVEIDKNKAGIKIELAFDLPFDRSLGAGAPGDTAASPRAGDVGFDLLGIDARVDGRVWVRGMQAPETVRGRLVATHAWMGTSESEFVQRRIEFFAPDDALSIYLSSVLADDGGQTQQLVIEREGAELVRTQHFAIHLEDAGDGDDDYPLPRVLRIASPQVEGEIRLGRALVAHDPMEALPQPFRFLLSFKSRPHRVWVDSVYEFRIEQGPVHASSVEANDVDSVNAGPPPPDTNAGDRWITLNGTGVTNVSFTNPLKDRS